ncbi:MAG: aminoacyl-tRNA deacylase [Gammaproteobacteria bacterium]
MGIASTVDFALSLTEVDFKILSHQKTWTSDASAHAGHVGADQLAKAVALKDELGPLLAVLPASHRLELEELRSTLHRPGLELMAEEDLAEVFFDCEQGAVPPLGPDYLVPTVVDLALTKQDDIYFEAGDHVELIHVSATSFKTLMRGAEYMTISSLAGKQG